MSFTFRLAFRRSFSSTYYCDQNTVNNNGIIGYGDYWRVQNLPSGSSYTIGSTGHHCTDFSTSEDWSQGENTFNATFQHTSTGFWRIGYVFYLIFFIFFPLHLSSCLFFYSHTQIIFTLFNFIDHFRVP